MPQPHLLNRLTFRQLQVFQAVHRLRSYSRAAEQLGLTQPAVSAQIRQLEQALGQPLFNYVKKTLYTLPAADVLSTSAQSIFDQLSSLQMELSELAGTIRGELNLAAVATAQYVAPHILARFRSCHPEVQVHLRVCSHRQAVDRLAERRDDLMIMGMVPNDPGLSFMPILDNEMIPVVWPGHPLLSAAVPSFEDFAQYTILLNEPHSGTRRTLEEFASRQRVTLSHTMTLGSNEAIKQGVIAQLGVAVLPRLAVQLELATGLLASPQLPEFPLRRSWCTVYLKDRPLSPVAELFLRFIGERLAELDAHFKAPLAPHSKLSTACLPPLLPQYNS